MVLCHSVSFDLKYFSFHEYPKHMRPRSTAVRIDSIFILINKEILGKIMDHQIQSFRHFTPVPILHSL